MSTVIAGVMARSYTGLDMFADLTPAALVRTFDKATGVSTLTFDDDLDDATVQAINDRMTSRDDADQARRADLRADRDGLADDDPLRRLYDYVLGD